MMFIRFTLVATLMVFVSATINLRSVVEDSVLNSEEVITAVADDEFVATVVASLMKHSESLKKNTHKQHSKFGKLAIESKNMKKQNAELMELRKGGGEKYVNDGYYVQKRRANSDCSGVPQNYFGNKIGHCQIVDTGYGIVSARTACVNNYKEDMVYELVEVYSSTDCSGEPYYVGLSDDPQASCGLDLEYYYDNLALNSQSNRCFPGTKGLDLPSGLYVTAHNDANCEDQPLTYDLMALNTCIPTFEGNPKKLNPNSEYNYFKLTSCSEGPLEVTQYSDSSCLRPVAKASIKNHPIDGQCGTSDEDGIYVKFSCKA